ncbi:MAG: hypothetical protein ACK5LO_13570 [Leucobacter sp.]
MAPEFGNTDGPLRGDREGLLTSRRLSASVSDVAQSLVLLERPAAITENSAARITQVGAYTAPSSPDGPFLIERGRIAVRIDAEAVTGAFLVGSDAGGAPDSAFPALRLHGPGDRIVHRCHALESIDRLVLDGIARAEGSVIAAEGAAFQPVASRRADELPDQLQRMDELVTRASGHEPSLPHRHIDPGVLFAVFEHVSNVALPLGIAVLSAAALQAVQEVVESVSWRDGAAVVTVHGAILEIALAGVHHCILLRLQGAHGPTSVLELYDLDNRCIAVLTQFGIVGAEVHEAWEHLTDSLPGHV